MWTFILGFTLVAILPLKWAASFTGAARTGLLACAAASLLGSALAVGAYRLSEGGFMGGVLAYIALVGGYTVILRVTGRSILGFSALVLALHMAAIAALFSFTHGRIDLNLAF
jgi:hypothetical protein